MTILVERNDHHQPKLKQFGRKITTIPHYLALHDCDHEYEYMDVIRPHRNKVEALVCLPCLQFIEESAGHEKTILEAIRNPNAEFPVVGNIWRIREELGGHIDPDSLLHNNLEVDMCVCTVKK